MWPQPRPATLAPQHTAVFVFAGTSPGHCSADKPLKSSQQEDPSLGPPQIPKQPECGASPMASLHHPLGLVHSRCEVPHSTCVGNSTRGT